MKRFIYFHKNRKCPRTTQRETQRKTISATTPRTTRKTKRTITNLRHPPYVVRARDAAKAVTLLAQPEWEMPPSVNAQAVTDGRHKLAGA